MPQAARRESAVVVFPWSTWAMMPMFLSCLRLWTIFSASDVDLNFGMAYTLLQNAPYAV